MVDAVLWTEGRCALWSRIEAHDFEPDVPFNFTRRLARDKEWTLNFTRAAIREYRRFCFLAAVSDGQSTPSEEVDEVWHQHLVYSRDYWQSWCRDILRHDLHHEPTAGGASEDRRFHQQYAETLKRYEDFFGPPPEMFWPASHKRFAATPRFRTVDTDRRMLLWRPVVWLRWLRRSGTIA